ncbi:MAG: macro domain-containing protein, partial [Candidatus Latescibacterota bacterium]
MIELTYGNLLEANAEALVNTVNCVGVMGKGIALQFKQAFPDNYTYYAKSCKTGQMQPGRVLVYKNGSMFRPKYIINFPTKRHWKGKSKMTDIDAGLMDLIAQIRLLGIRSIAIPPLGAGLGGLNWLEVKTRIESAFADLPDVQVLLFEPKGSPLAEK